MIRCIYREKILKTILEVKFILKIKKKKNFTIHTSATLYTSTETLFWQLDYFNIIYKNLLLIMFTKADFSLVRA